MRQSASRYQFLALYGTGLLVAATGVGAGDLATASFAGNKLGLTVLWAVFVGAFFKYVLTEGIIRWQIGTGTTFLDGCVRNLKLPFKIGFTAFLFPWSFFVGSALISACGVSAHALIPVFDNAATGKIVFGLLHSILGYILVRGGGFKLFERVMQVCIAAMFVVVVATAVMIKPDWIAVLKGLFIPSLSLSQEGSLAWTIALIGGVGGTLTILSYGYWIREKSEIPSLRICRNDLVIAYVMTAIFGLAMVIIGSTINIEGKGAGLIVSLADALEVPLGKPGRFIFLIGAWGAMFSSLLGVWQSVPYIFADFIHTSKDTDENINDLDKTRSYRFYLLGLTLIPLLALFFSFREVQKYYAIIGALFLPFLSIALLTLNGSKKYLGEKLRNNTFETFILIIILIFFSMAGYFSLMKLF